jgi:hypothetical protein
MKNLGLVIVQTVTAQVALNVIYAKVMVNTILKFAQDVMARETYHVLVVMEQV